MENSVYSVAIRSVRENDFLRRTLGSLQEQTILPQEIVIAIPADVQPWDTGEMCTSVRFVQAERGMVSQRAAGIVGATTEFLLLLDDDVVLAPNMAEVLLQTMGERQAACVVPCWLEGWPKKQFVKSLLAFWGVAIPQTIGGIHYTAGGGYYYPQQEPTAPWETQGGSGAVILVSRKFCLAHDCLGDMSLQEFSVYALRDDGAFILDIFQKGGRCLMVGGTGFLHLGGTTRLDPSRLKMAYTAQIYNHYLFWKNYIKPQHSKTFTARLWARLVFCWYLAGIMMFGMLASIQGKSVQPICGIRIGLKLLFGKMWHLS
ncbi:MAG: glycosyltransferase [Chlorobium sp.]|jgi:GT2 family glycosyltransferase|nr:glycosyltransferase [Chlorobium sp.]